MDNGDDQSVPITWQYNHHYQAYLTGKYSKIEKVDQKTNSQNVQMKGANNHGAKTFWFPFPRTDIEDPRPGSDVPTSQYFSEGNGGEFRYDCANYTCSIS